MIAALVASFVKALLKAGGLILDLVFTHVASICTCLLFHSLLQFNLFFQACPLFSQLQAPPRLSACSVLPVGGKVKPGTLFKISSYKYHSAQIFNLQTGIPRKSGLFFFFFFFFFELIASCFLSIFLEVCFQNPA